MSAPSQIAAAAREIESWARDHERAARALRATAKKMLQPPEGTRVEIHGNRVWFVSEVRP